MPRTSVVALAALAGALHLRSATHALPPVAPVRLAGFARSIPGRWITTPSQTGGVPIGGLGTGYLEAFPGGAIQLVPTAGAPPVSGIRLSLARVGSAKPIPLLGPLDEQSLRPPTRLLGHYPMAEYEYPLSPSTGLSVSVRLFGGVVARRPDSSNAPSALVRVTVANHSGSTATAVLRLSAHVSGSPGSEPFVERHTSGLLFLRPNRSETLALAGPPNCTASADGLVARLRLPARGSTAVLFAVAWHQPTEPDNAGHPILNRYAARFADARSVAVSALESADEIERGVIRWQEAVYAARYPAWLRDMLICALADLTRSTRWYVGGVPIQSSQPRLGRRGPGWSTADLALLLLFPDLDRDVLYYLARHQSPSGAVPYSADADEIATLGDGDALAACAFVARCRRHGIASLDNAYFRRIYPAAKAAMQFVMSADRNSDGLLDLPPGRTDDPDAPPSRSGAVYAIAGIGALRCAEEMAIDAGDGAFARYCHEQRGKALASLDKELWTGKYYRTVSGFDTGDVDDACSPDQLLGYLWARLGGVDPQIPRDRLASSIAAIRDQLQSAGSRHGDGVIAPESVWEWAAVALFASSPAPGDKSTAEALGTASRVWDRLVEQGAQWGTAAGAIGSRPTAAWCLPYGLARLSTAAPDRPTPSRAPLRPTGSRRR